MVGADDHQVIGPEQVEGGPVDGQVGLGPVDLVGAGLRADGPAVEDPGGGPQGVEPVGLGVHPGLGHRVGGPGGPDGVLVVGAGVQVDQAVGGPAVAGGAAQAEAALGARGGHGHVPPFAHVAEDEVVGHEDVLEEQFGEAGLAVDLGDRPHGHPGGGHVDQEVGEPAVALGVGVGAEQPEAPLGEGAA